MKTNSKLFAFAVMAFMLVGAFAIVADQGGSDADVGTTFEEGVYTYTILSEGDTNTVSIAATTPATYEGPLDLSTLTQVAHNEVTYTITGISSDGFKNASSLASMTLNENIVDIGSNALRGTAINSIDLTYVTSIGEYALSGTGLTTVEVPASVTSIAKNTFRECASLATVKWGPSEIPVAAFYQCTALGSFDLTNVTSIGDWAFFATGLTTVEVPASVTSLGANTFRGCASLTTVNWGPSDIPERTFQSCKALESFDLTNVTSIGDWAFYGSGITSITFPKNITISEGVFQNTQIKSVTFGGAVNSIANLDVFPSAGYEYAGGAILLEWTPELTTAPAAGTYTATLEKGEPSSYEMYAVDGSISYKAGDAFNYEAVSIQLNYEGFDSIVVSSADAGFEGITWYKDAGCTEAYTLGETQLSAGTVTLYFVYGTYTEIPATIVLNVTEDVAYDPEKTIDEQLAASTDLVIPSTADIKQDIALVENAQVLFEAGSKLTGSVSYGDGNIKFVDAVFKYNTLIAAGSVKIVGDVDHGMVIFEGTDNVISADFTVGEGVVVIFKDGCAVEIEDGATFTIPAGAYYQNYNGTLPVTGGTFVYGEATELVATEFIDEVNDEVNGTDYAAGFQVNLTLDSSFVTQQSYNRTVFWYLVHQEEPTIVYSDRTTVGPGDTEMSFLYNQVAERGSYDLYMVVYRDIVVDPTIETDAIVVAASSHITVNFLEEGWMIGLYIDDSGNYHAVVKNFEGDILQGQITTNAFATVQYDVGETDPITYVQSFATDLSYTIADTELGNVDFQFASAPGVAGEIISFQLRYDCSAQPDGFVMRSQQILDAEVTAAHETTSGNGDLQAVLYFAMVDSDDDGTLDTPVIYAYSAVAITDATITLWYNDGTDNKSVTATVSIGAGEHEIFEYGIFDAAYGDDFLADLLAGDVFLMSAYISAVDNNGTPDDTSDDVTNTTLEVISF